MQTWTTIVGATHLQFVIVRGLDNFNVNKAIQHRVI